VEHRSKSLYPPLRISPSSFSQVIRFSVPAVPAHSAEHGKTPMLQTILRRTDLQQVLKLGRSTIYDHLASDPTFPKPIRLTGKAVGWIESEVIAWQQKRIAERDKPAAPKRQRAARRRRGSH
jgi:prophage regulatory protein